MLASLGFYTFELRTIPFESEDHSKTYNWHSADRLGNAPANQFTGLGAEVLSLQGRLYPGQLTGGNKAISQLDRMAERGQTWPLMMGNGQYLGRWFIKKITTKKTAHMRDGSASKIEFTIELGRDRDDDKSRYGDLMISLNGGG